MTPETRLLDALDCESRTPMDPLKQLFLGMATELNRWRHHRCYQPVRIIKDDNRLEFFERDYNHLKDKLNCSEKLNLDYKRRLKALKKTPAAPSCLAPQPVRPCVYSKSNRRTRAKLRNLTPLARVLYNNRPAVSEALPPHVCTPLISCEHEQGIIKTRELISHCIHAMNHNLDDVTSGLIRMYHESVVKFACSENPQIESLYSEVDILCRMVIQLLKQMDTTQKQQANSECVSDSLDQQNIASGFELNESKACVQKPNLKSVSNVSKEPDVTSKAPQNTTKTISQLSDIPRNSINKPTLSTQSAKVEAGVAVRALNQTVIVETQESTSIPIQESGSTNSTSSNPKPAVKSISSGTQSPATSHKPKAGANATMVDTKNDKALESSTTTPKKDITNHPTNNESKLEHRDKSAPCKMGQALPLKTAKLPPIKGSSTVSSNSLEVKESALKIGVIGLVRQPSVVTESAELDQSTTSKMTTMSKPPQEAKGKIKSVADSASRTIPSTEMPQEIKSQNKISSTPSNAIKSNVLKSSAEETEVSKVSTQEKKVLPSAITKSVLTPPPKSLPSTTLKPSSSIASKTLVTPKPPLPPTLKSLPVAAGRTAPQLKSDLSTQKSKVLLTTSPKSTQPTLSNDASLSQSAVESSPKPKLKKTPGTRSESGQTRTLIPETSELRKKCIESTSESSVVPKNPIPASVKVVPVQPTKSATAIKTQVRKNSFESIETEKINDSSKDPVKKNASSKSPIAIPTDEIRSTDTAGVNAGNNPSESGIHSAVSENVIGADGISLAIPPKVIVTKTPPSKSKTSGSPNSNKASDISPHSKSKDIIEAAKVVESKLAKQSLESTNSVVSKEQATKKVPHLKVPLVKTQMPVEKEPSTDTKKEKMDKNTLPVTFKINSAKFIDGNPVATSSSQTPESSGDDETANSSATKLDMQSVSECRIESSNVSNSGERSYSSEKDIQDSPLVKPLILDASKKVKILSLKSLPDTGKIGGIKLKTPTRRLSTTEQIGMVSKAEDLKKVTSHEFKPDSRTREEWLTDTFVNGKLAAQRPPSQLNSWSINHWLGDSPPDELLQDDLE